MLKSFIRNLSLTLSIFAGSISYAAIDYQVEPQCHVVELAGQFEQMGVLKQKENGYLYLDVSNDFISKLLPLIDAPGQLVPPRHYAKKKGIGAHISVMYENEQIANEIWEVAELGQVFTFQIKELHTIKLIKNGQMKKLWLIAIEAPELERLRESYGLSPKLNDRDFYITIAHQIPGKAHSEKGQKNKHQKQKDFQSQSIQ